MAQSLGEAVFDLKLNDQAFQAGLREANQSVKVFTDSTGRLRDEFGRYVPKQQQAAAGLRDFADTAGNNALMTGPRGGPDHLNDLGRGCIAGWMQHHKGLAGLVAPTVGSYLRLQPASMSGYWCNWGGDHRGVTVRISEEGGVKTRLEHRMPDASANPHVAVAAILQAARLGVENGYPLPAPEAGDCFERTDAGHGVAASLAEAMDDLEADRALGDAVGRELTDHHVFMKRVEVDKTAGLTGAALRDYYIWYV